MWIFAQDLAETSWILAPRGPYAAMPGGYSWVPQQAQAHAPLRLDDLQESAGALFHWMAEYAASAGLSSDSFDVIGFSEGAALSIALALKYPARIRRLGILAGFAPAGAEGPITTPVLQGVPVFAAHGTQDQLVPIERFRQTVELLQRLGAHVEVCEAEIGHKVGAGCLRALKSFFA